MSYDIIIRIRKKQKKMRKDDIIRANPTWNTFTSSVIFCVDVTKVIDTFCDININ